MIRLEKMRCVALDDLRDLIGAKIDRAGVQRTKVVWLLPLMKHVELPQNAAPGN